MKINIGKEFLETGKEKDQTTKMKKLGEELFFQDIRGSQKRL